MYEVRILKVNQMKSVVKSSAILSGKPAMLIILVVMVISCTKSNNIPANTAVKYCKTISWTDTNGRTGTFIGSLVNNSFELTSVSYKEPLTTGGSVIFSYDANGHLMSQPGLTVTYNKDVLANYVVDLSQVSSAKGTGTFNFDANGQLTNVDFVGTNDNGPVTLSTTYTYDSNGDPVHIIGHGSETSSQGVGTADYDVTINYWTDKSAILAYVPIAASFSTYFATYGSILSKHLINQMSVTQTTTVNGKSTTISFSPIYLYTYDSNGRVVSMKQTGAPNVVFSFTYSGCN